MHSVDPFEVFATMAELASTRPVFHSEADFQFAFARAIQERHPSAAIRLEVPAFAGSRAHLDLQVRLSGRVIPIELKYWQARLNHVTADGEALSSVARGHARSRVQDLDVLETGCGFLYALYIQQGTYRDAGG